MVPSHPQDPLPFSEGWPAQLVRGLIPGQCDTNRSNSVRAAVREGRTRAELLAIRQGGLQHGN